MFVYHEKGDTIMIEYLKDIARGALIGVANIIPGVSGGTMALSMGIYEKIIHAINNLKKEFKQSLKTLCPYVIGIALGVAILSFLIEFCLDKYQLPTLMAFVGLILGGLGPIIKKVENEKFKVTHLLSFLFFAGIIIIPTLIATERGVAREMTFGLVSIIVMMMMGVVSAASMVVPGISGSMILMMLGYYDTIISHITIFVESALKFDIPTAWKACGTLVPFGIGVLLGIIIMAKIIEKLFKRYPNATMWGIMALVVTSPFAILWGVNLNISVMMAFVSFITFALRIYGILEIIEVKREWICE